MNSFMILLSLVANMAFCQTEQATMKQVSKNGMTVTWIINQDQLEVSMQAPSRGWLAIGFNTKDQLAGTNLIMAAVSAGETQISDRFILAPGEHKSVASLGAEDAVTLMEGQETKDSTHISFRLPLLAADKYHQHLQAGQRYYLLMAFSREDDFSHHSMKRTSVQIEL